MRGLIASFDDATNRAQAGISALKRTNDEIIDTLQKEMNKGRLLADELAILNESGDRLANRIEGGLKDRPANDGRTQQPDLAPSPADFGHERVRDTGLKSEAERELLETLRASR